MLYSLAGVLDLKEIRRKCAIHERKDEDYGYFVTEFLYDSPYD